MSATLWLRAERLDGVAVDAVFSDSVGVGSATAAVVSTSDAPRISARIGAVRIADLAETPTLVEQGLFCSARSAFGKRNRTPKYDTHSTRRVAVSSVAERTNTILKRHELSNSIGGRRIQGRLFNTIHWLYIV